MEDARIVGYVMSGSTPTRVAFVVRRDRRVAVGRYYGFRHPFFGPDGPTVFVRVYEITAINEEMESGRAAVLASSSGLVPDYPSELEYLLAESEVLGYRDPLSGEISPLEAPPSTMTPVVEPTAEELAHFVGDTATGGTPVRVGGMRGLGAPLHLDLDAVARGHMFVAGMTRSGKSVSGDTVIAIYDVAEDMMWLGPIGDFFAVVRGQVGGVRYFTLALNRRTLQPEWAPVKAILAHPSPQRMYEIVTETGRRLRVTGDHSLLVFRGGRVATARPESVRVGRDFLVVPWGGGELGRGSLDPELASVAGVVAAQGHRRDRSEIYVIGAPDDFRLSLMSLGVGWTDLRDPSSLLIEADGVLDLAAREGPAFALRYDGRTVRAALASALGCMGTGCNGNGEFFLLSRSRQELTAASTLAAVAGVRTVEFGDDYLVLDSRDLKVLREEVAGRFSGAGLATLRVPLDGPRRLRLLAKRMIGSEDLVDKERLIRARERLVEAAERARDPGERALLERLLRLVSRVLNAKVTFERIVAVIEVDAEGDLVYDLSVDRHENFLANGAFVHNSSFTLNLIRRGMEAAPGPRFLVLDRRGEYEGLADLGGVVMEYRAFLPTSGALRPEDVARRAGIDRGTRAWELTVMAAEEAAEAGDMTVDGIISRARTLAARMALRDRTALLRRLEARLRRAAGDIERSRGEGVDVVRVLGDFPAVVVDLSLDNHYDDQFVALRRIIRRLVSHAVSRRRAGDFAAIVVVEEAQYLAPERGSPVVGDPYGSGIASALTEAVSQAGGYNLGFIVVTQRPSYVSKGVISQCNTVAAFRLQSGNDQEAIAKYTEAGEAVVRFLPSLRDHEAVIWGMASPIPFPVVVRVEVEAFPAKASARPSEAWRRMAGAQRRLDV